MACVLQQKKQKSVDFATLARKAQKYVARMAESERKRVKVACSLTLSFSSLRHTHTHTHHTHTHTHIYTRIHTYTRYSPLAAPSLFLHTAQPRPPLLKRPGLSFSLAARSLCSPSSIGALDVCPTHTHTHTHAHTQSLSPPQPFPSLPFDAHPLSNPVARRYGLRLVPVTMEQPIAEQVRLTAAFGSARRLHCRTRTESRNAPTEDAQHTLVRPRKPGCPWRALVHCCLTIAASPSPSLLQGAFDLVLHKATTVMALAEEGCPEALKQLRRLTVRRGSFYPLARVALPSPPGCACSPLSSPHCHVWK